MDPSITRDPNPNEFSIPDDEAYARTEIETVEAIEFLLTKLEPIILESLDPDQRTCPICRQDYHFSEDAKLSHLPVQMECGHIFGKLCITRWLDPICFYGTSERFRQDVQGAMERGELDTGKTSCPTCRRVFFPETSVQPLEMLATPLWLWDQAYAFAGVARSPKEERSRRVLLEYVEYCRSVNQARMFRRTEYRFLEMAQRELRSFAESLQTQELTPVQEDLREELERLGTEDWKEMFCRKYVPVLYVVDGESQSEHQLESPSKMETSSHEENEEDEDQTGENDEQDEQDHQPDRHSPQGT